MKSSKTKRRWVKSDEDEVKEGEGGEENGNEGGEENQDAADKENGVAKDGEGNDDGRLNACLCH